MAKIKKIIEPEVLNVLNNLEINEEELSIKILITLDRETYDKVNKLFILMGGKWNTRTKKHIFKYKNLEETINSIKDEGKSPVKNPFDFFPTPEELAKEMVDKATLLLPSTECYEILEPSGGTGRICKELRNQYVYSNIEVCEIDEYNKSILQLDGFEIIADDFLTLTNKEYDLIVMNPPFNINNDSLAYIIHIKKAFELLKPGGVLISIAPISFTFTTTNKKLIDFHLFVMKNGGYELNKKSAFKESKTLVETATITLRKR